LRRCIAGQALFACATNYLIDMDHAIIVDAEALVAEEIKPDPFRGAVYLFRVKRTNRFVCCSDKKKNRR